MDRREFLKRSGATAPAIAGSTLLGMISRASEAEAQQAVVRPNFLVICTDDQPWQSLARMRKVNADLAAPGIRFDNGYVVTPFCDPARAAMFSGMFPHNSGSDGGYAKYVNLGLETNSLAVRTKAAGYRVKLAGKYFNGFGESDRYHVPPGFDDFFALAASNSRGFSFYDNGRLRTYKHSRSNETRVITDNVLKFVQRQASRPNQPWLCFCHYHAPHAPYFPSPAHEHHADNEPLPKPPNFDEQDLSDKPKEVRAQAPFTEAERASALEAWRGTIEELGDVDDGVRKIVSSLASTNQLANTLIFYLTDNGFLFGEHGLLEKDVPYLESAKTPFVVRGPGVPAGGVSDKLISQVDLPATICDHAGANSEGIDGRSLRPLFGDATAPWRKRLLIDNPHHGWHQLLEKDYAYIEWDTGERELYDLRAPTDPYEMSSLHADPAYAQQMADFAAKLISLRSSGGDALRAAEEA
jgi:N-acetylglucosamine-6-sulfatase